MKDIELSDEQREAALELSPEELRFATLWLNRSENGMAAWKCVAEAYKGHDANNKNSCNVTAMRLINHNDRVRRFINAMNKSALRAATYDTARIYKMFQRQAVSSEEKLDPYVEWRYVTGRGGKQVRRAWAPNIDVIGRDVVEVVTGYEECPEGGIYINYRELCSERERQKAGELLAKMAGDFVERVEHSGGVINGSVELDPTDPVKASQDYRKLMGGGE